MLNYVVGTGLALSKRALTTASSADGPQQFSPAVWPVALLNIVVFLVPIIFTRYTLGSVFPTLAIIEDVNSNAAYEAVSPDHQKCGKDEEDKLGSQMSDARATNARAGSQQREPVTSSIRAINRVVYSHGGWRSYLRGLLCATATNFLAQIITSAVGAVRFVPSSVGGFVAALALTHFHTAWVHIVISATPPSMSFWHRIPSFRPTLEATWLPTILCWAAYATARVLPTMVALLLNLDLWDPSRPTKIPAYETGSAWKYIVVGTSGIIPVFFLVIPATFVLVRIQASLLPSHLDGMVPFNRYFGGNVGQPAGAGLWPRSYAAVRHAFNSFSRESWVRIFKVYVKVLAIVLATYCVVAAAVTFQLALLDRALRTKASTDLTGPATLG